MASAARSWRVSVAVALLGVGLVAAPVVFQMFTRAPKGGDMITSFEPYMSSTKIDEFRGYLTAIGTAESEVRARQIQAANLARDWPVINSDMRAMLDTMERNITNYEGVAALPPFPLFPWFFVIPGVLLAGLGATAVRRPQAARRLTAATLAIGLGLIAAPGIFQMFTRAPGGARMIDDFRPLMTTEKVTAIQGYFLSLGAAEGELRNDVLPTRTAELPATQHFVDAWPRISFDMAPMIGTMADSLDNFAAVDALPDFWLFPWFFVLPGVLVAGLSLAGRRGSEAPLPTRTPQRDLVEGQPA